MTYGTIDRESNCFIISNFNSHLLHILCNLNDLVKSNFCHDCLKPSHHVTWLLNLHSCDVSEFIELENCPPNSADLHSYFLLWGTLQQKLYRQKITDVDCLKCVSLHCRDHLTHDTVDQLPKMHRVEMLIFILNWQIFKNRWWIMFLSFTLSEANTES